MVYNISFKVRIIKIYYHPHIVKFFLRSKFVLTICEFQKFCCSPFVIQLNHPLLWLIMRTDTSAGRIEMH